MHGTASPAATTLLRVLVMGAGTSLSHTARAAAVAQMLETRGFQVTLACDQRYQALLGVRSQPIPIHSVALEDARSRAQRAQPVIDAATLTANVREDLALFDAVSPDVVVGDLRQSLAISCRLAHIPYVTILDPHWSPYARTRFEVAEHWLANKLGYMPTQRIFKTLYPLGSAVHSLPFNQVSIRSGLGPMGLSIRRIYAHANYVLYPGVPELVPTFGRPAHHVYLGPIVWSPHVADPEWWTDLPSARPVVYVGLGTTGQPALLPTILAALADLPVTVMVSTADRANLTNPPRNALVAPYLSGTRAASRSALVVCNGGTMSTQQALSVGAPVLGLVSNADQMVFMRCVMDAGAGERLRESDATGARIRALVVHMLLSIDGYRAQAARLQQAFAGYDSACLVAEVVKRAARGPR